MNQQRVRVRFAKQGDLKLIGHRDLVRAFERLFRRVDVELAMSQGFHPRPMMTFPDALAIGIAAENEVMDIALRGEIDPVDLCRRLNEQAPEGLMILEVRLLGDGDRKVKVDRVCYAFKLPEKVDPRSLEQGVDLLQSQSTLCVSRKDKQVEVNLQETLDGLWIADGYLQMRIRVTQQSPLQPRDILAALGLRDALREGAQLTRTQVEISS